MSVENFSLQMQISLEFHLIAITDTDFGLVNSVTISATTV